MPDHLGEDMRKVKNEEEKEEKEIKCKLHFTIFSFVVHSVVIFIS